MVSLLSYPFIQNAFLAGTCIAIVAAVTGYFLLLRGLTFAGHALPNIGFAGAAGAVLLGLDPLLGLLAFTIGAAIGIGLLGRNLRERDLAIGILMAFALALGLLFLSLYSGYAERVYSILFGTILGISRLDVLLSFGVSLLILVSILLLFRPLLFSSYDPEVAEARGVPVRLLAVVFLVLVALAIAIAVQIVGALLVFTLLVGPVATAGRLALRPGAVILLAILLGLLYTWLGILLAVLSGTIPVSFFIAFLSFIIYLPVRLIAPRWQRRRLRPDSLSAPAPGAGLSQQASAR
ncbi:metal ABC transporter permease [Thermogemmatispora onikobensis]|uniref:metal ABC transporter permease n=1 Tax=Thermogemmatispora onikobensis TaxID=732234 RepID=UPI000852F04A|nr:metal ABC transporter permease [Thermogemmatispora onikobensis]